MRRSPKRSSSSSLKNLLTKPACLCCNINSKPNGSAGGGDYDDDLQSETVGDNRRTNALLLAAAAANDFHFHRSRMIPRELCSAAAAAGTTTWGGGGGGINKRMMLHIDHQQQQQHQMDGNCGDQHQMTVLENLNSTDANDLHQSQFSLFMQLFNNLNAQDLNDFKILLNSTEPIFEDRKELNGLDLWQESNLFLLIKILKFIIYLYLNFNVINDKLPPLQHRDSPDNSQTSLDYDSDPDENLIKQIDGFIDQLYRDNKSIIGPRIVLNTVAIMEYIFSGLAVCTDIHNWRLTVLMAFILSAKTNNDKVVRIKCFSQSLARMNLTERKVIKIERDMLIKLNFNSIYTDAILCKIANDAANILNESSSQNFINEVQDD